MAHVFVSYDRDDRDFAEVVQAKLERAGHQTSLDLDILRAGDDWQDKLDAAIRGSDAIVVIMGPEARASDYVAYEWAFALGAGVTVIPLELRTTPFPPRLDGLHRLDFTGKNRPWDTLLAEVARAEAGRRAANVAGDPNTPPAVQQAVRSIDSLVAEERFAAVKTLAQTAHPTALEALAQALEHPVKDVRIAAATLFPDRTNPKIVCGLVEAYQNDVATWFTCGMPGNSPGPKELVDAITGIGAPAVPGLLDALKRLGVEPKQQLPRKAILEALGRTGSVAAIPSLQEALQDQNDHIRIVAAEALGQLGDPAVATALRSALADPAEYVRAEAARSLGFLHDAAAVPDLIECLQDDTNHVRMTAAAALGTIGDRSSVPAIIVALRDENYSVRKAAAVALGRLGDPAAILSLRELLNETDTEVNELDMEVMTALVRLRDTESFAAIANRLIGFRSGNFGGDVYDELARYGDEGVQALLRVLSAPSKTLSHATQTEAAKALASIRTPEVVSALKAWRRKRG